MENTNIKSAEDPKLKEFDLFIDADQLESRKTGLNLLGKVRTMRPVSRLDQIKLANMMLRLTGIMSDKPEKVNADQLKEAYWQIFSMIIDPLDQSEFNQMSYRQITTVYQGVEDHIMSRVCTHRVITDEEKKKYFMVDPGSG